MARLSDCACVMLLLSAAIFGFTSYKTPDVFTDTTTQTTQGIILMGGSTEPDDAMRWMIARMGGGDFLVLRASGSDGYNDYIYRQLGGVHSVETIVFDSRSDALLPEIERKIRNAEGLWLAGGDQGDYVNFWKDTPVETAINYLIREKKIPVGGTSAGCAVMTPVYFGATAGAPTSAEALANPRLNSITAGIGFGDFITPPFLDNTISDTHYAQRSRQGRHLAFLAHMLKNGLIDIKGIGVDERTAVCVDEKGKALVFGSNDAYFIRQYCDGPEVHTANTPLTWRAGVRVYKVAGTSSGTGYLELTNWQSGSGGSWEYWHADIGTLKITATPAIQCTTPLRMQPAAGRIGAKIARGVFPALTYNPAGQRMPTARRLSPGFHLVPNAGTRIYIMH